MEHFAPAELQQSIIEFADAFSLSEEEVTSQLNAEHGWQNKYRRIMLLGKTLPAINPELKTEQNLVQGCESQVWLAYVWHDGILKIASSSDAKIVKGLITIVLAAYNHKSREQIEQFDISGYLESLGLLEQLSPSRGNGIKAIVDAIRAF